MLFNHLNISFIYNRTIPNVILNRTFFTDTDHSYVFNANGEEMVTSTVNNESIVAEANNDSMEIIPLTYSEICNFSNLEKGLARTKSGKSAGLDGDVKATWTQSKLEKLAL